MPRILAIDYGIKRVGIATTDPLQIIATPLTTIPNHELLPYLQKYLQQEEVEAVVVGMPTKADGSDTHSTPHIRGFVRSLQKLYPDLAVHTQDEKGSSQEALEAMISGGTSKKYRRQKENLDKISAVIILQRYLESRPTTPPNTTTS
ncbi:Holliday junction resolvase RuvX [Eisenibacter elegans]|jgi:putative Holliday junction resolvase|uniref:Holliday junction resolvase RuvX n=1 Tax=Eisenibacter elegans TaxID=997 RepID=UPI000479F246|nr:Holliday junction resolvase RuvX [Eisenibacter elegans]